MMVAPDRAEQSTRKWAVSSSNFLHEALAGSGIAEASLPAMKSPMSSGIRLPFGWSTGLGIRLFLVGLVGLFLTFLPAISFWGHFEFQPRDIGVALMTAAVLGFTIDFWLKRTLTEDAVRATLGSILNPVFHGELRRLFGYDFLCERHFLRLEIVSIPDTDYVRVKGIAERDVKNITSQPRFKNSLSWVDDWGIPGEQSSAHCSAQTDTGMIYDSGPASPPNRYSIKAETEQISVPPNKTLKLLATFSEVRTRNDHFIVTFRDPTVDPVVEIRISDDLEIDFEFGRSLGPDEKIEVSETIGHYRLRGMYFPGFYMKARWWPKGWAVSTTD
jgi:hypothetical protein